MTSSERMTVALAFGQMMYMVGCLEALGKHSEVDAPLDAAYDLIDLAVGVHDVQVEPDVPACTGNMVFGLSSE